MAHSLGPNKSVSYESTSYKKVAGSGDHNRQIELMIPINAVPNIPSLTSEPGWTTRTALESLIPLAQLLVQKEAQTCNCRKAYQIKADLTPQLFQAVETSNCVTNCYWGSKHSFEMKIFDNSGQEVIHLHHSLRNENCSSLPQIEVFSPPDTLVGLIQVERSCCRSLLTVKNGKRESVLIIDGSCCVSTCFGSVVFRILASESCLPVGQITKHSTRWFGRGNSYKINFPGDLDVKMKAVMIGACILIDIGIRPTKFCTGLVMFLMSIILAFILSLAFETFMPLFIVCVVWVMMLIIKYN